LSCSDALLRLAKDRGLFLSLPKISLLPEHITRQGFPILSYLAADAKRTFRPRRADRPICPSCWPPSTPSYKNTAAVAS
jgi:hypothetical protein